MATTESSPLADVPTPYDAAAGAVVLLILAWAFLYAFMPIFGLLAAVAFGSAYAAGRVDDLEHGVVVGALWAVVLGAFWVTGTYVGVAVATVVAVLGYGRWLGTW